MYLLIYAGHELRKTKEIEKTDLEDCNKGLFQIVDMDSHKEYFSGEWHDLEEI